MRNTHFRKVYIYIFLILWGSTKLISQVVVKFTPSPSMEEYSLPPHPRQHVLSLEIRSWWFWGRNSALFGDYPDDYWYWTFLYYLEVTCAFLSGKSVEIYCISVFVRVFVFCVLCFLFVGVDIIYLFIHLFTYLFFLFMIWSCLYIPVRSIV